MIGRQMDMERNGFFAHISGHLRSEGYIGLSFGTWLASGIFLGMAGFALLLYIVI